MKIGNNHLHGVRKFTFKKAVKEVMRDRFKNRFMGEMENMLTRIIREETGRVLQQFFSSRSLSWSPIEQSRSETQPRQQLKLRFINSPQDSIFTGLKIETKNGSPLTIELVNAVTNARIVSGPLSSSKVEIVPLNAEFTEEEWTVNEFKRNILQQRKGKQPLLTGDLTVTLRNGVGMISSDLAFSDNSSWTRTRKFRLGGELTGGEAMEARTEPFGCKDQRGAPYMKHYPPNHYDDVWRLKNIAKQGVLARLLAEHQIFTVKDFLRWYTMYPDRLYHILGGRISKKIWEAIVKHALTCVLDKDECYIYKANANTNHIVLLLNSVYEVIKVSVNCGPFWDVDQLTSFQPLLDELKLEAYENVNTFIPVDYRNFANADDFVDHPQRSLSCPGTLDPGSSVAETRHINFQGISNPSSSSSSSMSLYHTETIPNPTSLPNQPEMLINIEGSSQPPTFHIDGTLFSALRNSFRVREHDQTQDPLRNGNVVENHEEENGLDLTTHWSPGSMTWNQQQLESLRVSLSGTEEAGVYDVRIANINGGSPRGRWGKVWSVLKVRQVWRQAAARNRR